MSWKNGDQYSIYTYVKAISLIDEGENPQQWLIIAEWPETLVNISRINYTWMIWLYI